jgi:hypothetical protein
VVEGGGTGGGGVDREVAGELGAVADEDDVRVAVGVEADAEAGDGVVAVRGLLRRRDERLRPRRAGQDGAVGQGGGDGVVAGDGGVFTPDFLRGVVRVEGPAVLAGEALCGVLPHDLGAGDGLALGEGVAVADVEDEAGGLAHRLDADEVVGDELGIALADQGEGEAGEVRDVGGGGLILEEDRPLLWVPGVELVFQDGGHEAELLGADFAALAQDRGPLADELVFLGLVDDRCTMAVSLLGHDAGLPGPTFGEVTTLSGGGLASGLGRAAGEPLIPSRKHSKLLGNFSVAYLGNLTPLHLPRGPMSGVGVRSGLRPSGRRCR